MRLKLFLRTRRGALVYWLAALGIIFTFAASAQRGASVVAKKGFSAVLENFEPPNEAQIKTLLQCSEAEPREGGSILMRDMQLISFSELGQTQMVVLSPRCVFDTEQRTVQSDDKIELRTGDGRFLTSGRGFFWRQTNGILQISNVQTKVHGSLTNSFFQ